MRQRLLSHGKCSFDIHETNNFVLLCCRLLRYVTQGHYFELPLEQLKCSVCLWKRETESIECARIEELNVAVLSKNGKLSIEFNPNRVIWIRPNFFECLWCVCHWWTLISSYIARRLCARHWIKLDPFGAPRVRQTSDASVRSQFEINYYFFGYCSSWRAPSLPPSPPSIDNRPTERFKCCSTCHRKRTAVEWLPPTVRYNLNGRSYLHIMGTPVIFIADTIDGACYYMGRRQYLIEL